MSEIEWKARFQKEYPEFVYMYTGEKTWQQFYNAVKVLLKSPLDYDMANRYVGQKDMLAVLASLGLYPSKYHGYGQRATQALQKQKDGGNGWNCKTCGGPGSSTHKDGGHGWSCQTCAKPQPKTKEPKDGGKDWCPHMKTTPALKDGGYQWKCDSCGVCPVPLTPLSSSTTGPACATGTCMHMKTTPALKDGGYQWKCDSCGVCPVPLNPATPPKDGGSDGAGLGLGLGLVAGVGIGAMMSNNAYERGRRDASY